MRILNLTYHYKVWGWQLTPLAFTDLNLLVGASSVGKTQIIKAILDLKQIASGESVSGVSWDISFTIKQTTYRWTGETENIGSMTEGFFKRDLLKLSQHPKLIREQLFCQGNKLVDRNRATINFKGITLPVKLPTRESIISLFNEDEHIAPIYNGFSKIIYKLAQLTEITAIEQDLIDLTAPIYHTLAGIRQSDLTILLKLGLTYRYLPETFTEIKERFIEIFPHVEDIKVEMLARDAHVMPYLSLREHGMTAWMPSSRISSGMIKSLIFIANLYLCDEGTVILIDEFENSLGVNCIDILNDVLIENRALQFVITSHHPYIINNIPMINWQIVTRKGDVVTVKTADQFELGDSKHEAFMQLLQLEEFTDGILSA